MDNTTTVIMGEPGAGKTSLAATWPNSLFILTEKGKNLTAARGMQQPNTIEITPGPNAYPEVMQHLRALAALEPSEDGTIEYQGYTVQSVVIDTLDGIQDAIKSFHFNGRMSMQKWGELLEMIQELLFVSQSIKVPQVWVCRVKEFDPIYSEDDNTIEQLGERKLALQGSIGTKVEHMATSVLHLTVSSQGDRMVVFRKTRAGNYKIRAADSTRRMRQLAEDDKPYVRLLDVGGGYPTYRVANALCGINREDELYEALADSQ